MIRSSFTWMILVSLVLWSGCGDTTSVPTPEQAALTPTIPPQPTETSTLTAPAAPQGSNFSATPGKKK